NRDRHLRVEQVLEGLRGSHAADDLNGHHPDGESLLPRRDRGHDARPYRAGHRLADQPPQAAGLDHPARRASPVDWTARLDMIRKGTKILVVEDDASISRLLQLELEHRDFVVHVEDNGLGALKAIESFRPDAV